MTVRLRFVLRRLVLTVPILLVMSVFVFLVIRLVPGDPVRTMRGFRATPQNVAQVRHDLHLDDPLWVQYRDWVVALLHGQLGQDFVSKPPPTELLSQRIPVTLEITLLSMFLAIAVGVPLGVRAAVGSRWARRLTEGFVVFGVSVPDFWLGIMLVLLFAVTMARLPPSGYVPFTVDPVGNLRYLVLPVLTLAVAETAYIIRTTRGSMLGVMGRPFITYLHDADLVTDVLDHAEVVTDEQHRDAEVALQAGDYLGGIVEKATKTDLFADPVHPYTRALLAAIPVPHPDARLIHVPLSGDIPSPVDPPSGCPFHPRCTLRVDSCSQQRPSLHPVGTAHDVACPIALGTRPQHDPTPAQN